MSIAVLATVPRVLAGAPPQSPDALTLAEFSALAVDINIAVNPDGMVAQATIADQARFANDPVFRSVAESDLKAIRDPKCSPLALPLDKYDQWKSMTIHFDPKEVSGK